MYIPCLVWELLVETGPAGQRQSRARAKRCPFWIDRAGPRTEIKWVKSHLRQGKVCVNEVLFLLTIPKQNHESFCSLSVLSLQGRGQFLVLLNQPQTGPGSCLYFCLGLSLLKQALLPVQIRFPITGPIQISCLSVEWRVPGPPPSIIMS